VPTALSNISLGGPNFEDDPKNGTPWFRMKHQSDFGKADHAHFGGLHATGDFKQDMLTAHNTVRSRVGIPSLTWNPALENLANEYVSTLVNGGCYIQHSATSYRWNEGGFDYVGENLYKVINMKPTGTDITDAWYAEVNDYVYGRVGDYCVKSKCATRTSPPCAMGHFTQVMWEPSSDVGCARKQCLYQDDPTYIAVCYYGTGGNIAGNIPFNANAAGSLGVGSAAC
jgi:pathogenesis-related protein 1